MTDQEKKIKEEIVRIKLEKKVLFLAHYYQNPEIQDLADFIGDSLALAQEAYKTSAGIILFAGVHFMAETAKILNPEKKVLIPDMEAGCSLADSCPADSFKQFIQSHPDHKVISYINCSAEVKALSDIICTSSNAVNIVHRFPENQPLIFAPDKNLGAYVNKVTGRNMLLWNGTCEVHDLIRTEAVMKLKQENPDAKLIAHPECKAVILELADFVGSTTALLQFTIRDKGMKYIVATETGILYQMQKASPEKEFLIVPADQTCSCNDCPYMKLNTLPKILRVLKEESNEILLDPDLMDRARKPILRMLEK